MDPKTELELIMKTMENLGSAGQVAFIWWVIKGMFNSLMTVIGFITCVSIICRSVIISIREECDEST